MYVQSSTSVYLWSLVVCPAKCTGSVLDSQGNWTAEEGRYKKTELCKQYDLDVSSSLGIWGQR